MERYDSYKDSGVEWIGEIPIHWEKSKVKYHFHLISGFPFSSEDITNEEREYPIIRIGNVTSGKTDVYFEGELSDKHPLVNYGDYVVSLTGDFSIRKWENKSSLLNQRCGLIRKFTSDDERFLFYYLPFQFRILEKTKYFTTLKNLSNGELLDIEFILPPLSEQQQIVSFLDTKTSLIDSLIEKTQRKIELLKEKRTSLINEVVTKGLNPNVEMKDSGVEWIGKIPSGWKNGRLGYYSNVYRGSGYQYLNQVDEDYEGGKERVVRISDITEFNPIWCEYQEQFENYRIQPDDILIGGTGHYFGKSIYVTKEMEGLIHSYNIIRVVIKSQYPKYVQYWLSSSKIREQMDISVLGSGQPFIDIQGLKDLHILIPPLSEQRQIVEYLDEQTQLIDKTITIEERRIELLKEYRQSLISEVVTGKQKVVE